MQILKDKKILLNYILPIVLMPFICFIAGNLLEIIFKIGIGLGTFMRALFELVVNSI